MHCGHPQGKEPRAKFGSNFRFFFLSGFSFTTIHEEEGISLTPHYYLHLLHRHLDISRVVTTESSPLHIGSSQELGTFGFRAQAANH